MYQTYYMKYIIYSVLILFMISCGSSSENSSEESDTNSIKEFAFQCPMKCEGSGSDTQGTCNVCKMDLIEM